MATDVPALLQCSLSPSPLLRYFSYKGFSHAIHFPRSLPGRVYQALGFGLLKHFSINYPEINSFIQKTYRPDIVPAFAKLYSRITTDLETYCANPEFWTAIQTATTETISRCDSIMPDKKAALLARGDIDISRPELIKNVCEALLLTIVTVQTCEEGYIQNEYVPVKIHISLIVVLGVDGDDIYLMLHSKLADSAGTSGLPFYNRIEDKKPIRKILDNTASVEHCASDSQDNTQLKLTEIVKLMTSMSKFASGLIQSNAQKDAIFAAITHFETVNSYLQEDFPFLEDLQKIKEFASNPTNLTGPHYLQDCPQYDTSLPYFTLPCCGRQIHNMCLSQWIEREVGGEKKPGCPFCMWELAEKVIEDMCPDLYGELREKKKLICSMKEGRVDGWTEDRRERQVQCLGCRGIVNDSWIYVSESCSCSVCLTCVNAATHCPLCHRSYSPHEQVHIQSSYRFKSLNFTR